MTVEQMTENTTRLIGLMIAILIALIVIIYYAIRIDTFVEKMNKEYERRRNKQ